MNKKQVLVGLAIVLTAALAGIGIYIWRKNQFGEKSTKEAKETRVITIKKV